MPRLRYYKRFEAIDDRQTSEELDGFTNTEEPTGQSWWSNRNIITGLSDAKIKQAIGYHKQMVTFLENELCGRAIGRRDITKLPEFNSPRNRKNNRQSIHETVLQTRQIISPSLRRSLAHVRRKFGNMAAEKVKKEWEIILQQYRKGA